MGRVSASALKKSMLRPFSPRSRFFEHLNNAVPCLLSEKNHAGSTKLRFSWPSECKANVPFVQGCLRGMIDSALSFRYGQREPTPRTCSTPIGWPSATELGLSGRDRVSQQTVPRPPDSFSIADNVCQYPV